MHSRSPDNCVEGCGRIPTCPIHEFPEFCAAIEPSGYQVPTLHESGVAGEVRGAAANGNARVRYADVFGTAGSSFHASISHGVSDGIPPGCAPISIPGEGQNRAVGGTASSGPHDLGARRAVHRWFATLPGRKKCPS